MTNFKFFCNLVLLSSSLAVQAASEAPRLKPVLDQWLIKDGAIRGGQANAFMTILDLRDSASVKLKTERLVIDWGNGVGLPAAQGGYYQVEYQAAEKRVVINLAMTVSSKVESHSLKSRFAKALYVKSAILEYDVISQCENLVLTLKKNVKVRVASYPSHLQDIAPARLVVDLVE